MNSEGQRNLGFIDAAKGIGVILVVLGHAISKDYIQTSNVLYCIRYIIYLVHMPVFFMISGFLFERNKDNYARQGFFRFFQKKAVVYLLPYAFFSGLLYLLGFVALFTESQIATLIQRVGFTELNFGHFLYTLLTFINHPDNHLWFVYVMFCVLMIAYIIRKIPVRYTLPVLYMLYILTWYVRLPEIGWKIIRYLLIFQIGRGIYAIYRYREENRKTDLIVVSVAAITIGLMVCFDSRGIKMLQALVKPFAEVSSAITIMYFSNMIMAMKKHGSEGIKKAISFVGIRSYSVYMIHQPYIVPLVTVICKNHLPVIGTIIVAFVCGLTFSFVLNEFVINKSRILKLLILGGH